MDKIKILIIDDETIVRFGMRYIIPWEKYGYKVIGEASNGNEAIELARAYKPHIILTDIVMPELDGLDFIERVREELPETKFIVFSCHDDADFYRKAIKLGVCDYIQKSSITPDEILKAVNSVAEKIKSEFDLRSGSNNIKRKKINYPNGEDIDKVFFSYISGHQLDDYDASNSHENKSLKAILKKLGLQNIVGKPIYLAIFYLNNWSQSHICNKETMLTHITTPDLSQNKSNLSSLSYNGGFELNELTLENEGKVVVYKNKFDIHIKNIAYNIFTSEGIVSVHILNPKNNFFVSVAVFKKKLANFEDYLRDICFRLNENVYQMFNLRLTFGISERINNYRDLEKAYSNAFSALMNYYTHGFGNIYFYKETSKDDESIEKINLMISNETEKIINTKHLFEIDKILDSFLRIIELVRGCYNFNQKQLKAMSMDILHHVMEMLRNENININDIMGSKFNSIDFIEKPKTFIDLAENMVNLLKIIGDYYKSRFKGKEKKIIDYINDYIESHLCEHIGLIKIASKVHLNPSYLSRLYKKKTGMTLQQYRTFSRVEKSKGMIVEGYSISQIIKKIGFSSESHFFRTFKIVTGMTPKEYKKTIMGS